MSAQAILVSLARWQLTLDAELLPAASVLTAWRARSVADLLARIAGVRDVAVGPTSAGGSCWPP
jgi:hypothetical protein